MALPGALSGDSDDPEKPMPSVVDTISDVPSIDAISGWFGADLSGSMFIVHATVYRR